tara:strand:- start:354 stop:533 length:180 start_codon:yes stop_codon:yes gene_type:complete
MANKSKGLGDILSKFIRFITGGKVKECGGCAARKAWLNRKVPYDTGKVLYALSQLKRKG